MKKFKTVESFIADSGKWEESLIFLREILLSTGLEETVKWGAPCYCLNNKNIVGIGSFKSYAGLWFYQGVFLKDKKKKLLNAQEGVTKAMRQWRFQSLEEIQKDHKIILQYIREAIKNQEQGLELKPEKNKSLSIPPELAKRFSSSTPLKRSFESLNLTKRREFAEYISAAKRTETKENRLEKIIPMILEGKGLNDKYRK